VLIAVDFDGTCIDAEGEDQPFAADVLRYLASKGHKLMLWTCRENGPGLPHYLDEAVAWFRERGIPLHSVNENNVVDVRQRTRKMIADVYVDDRVIGGFPGWPHVMGWVHMLEVSQR